MQLDSPLAFNLYEHSRTFLEPGPHANFHLALLAAAGYLWLLSPLGRSQAGHRLLLSLWWGLPLAFSIFIWEPSWDHYFVQYLAPFAILGGLALSRLASISRFRLVARAVAVAIVLFAAVLGPGHWNARRIDYQSLARPSSAGESWLLFDPFLNFMTGTRPACGIIDPFNVYGEQSLIGRGDAKIWSRHRISAEALIACLERDPTIRIGSGSIWGSWFKEGRLAAYLDGLPDERFFSLWRHSR